MIDVKVVDLKVIGCLARCSGVSRLPFTKLWYA